MGFVTDLNDADGNPLVVAWAHDGFVSNSRTITLEESDSFFHSKSLEENNKYSIFISKKKYIDADGRNGFYKNLPYGKDSKYITNHSNKNKQIEYYKKNGDIKVVK